MSNLFILLEPSSKRLISRIDFDLISQMREIHDLEDK